VKNDSQFIHTEVYLCGQDVNLLRGTSPLAIYMRGSAT